MALDYAVQIKELIDGAPSFQPDWHHPLNLALILEAYLHAKSQKHRLTATQQQLNRTIAAVFDPIVGGDAVIFVDPKFSQANALVALAEAESMTACTALQAFGKKLTVAELKFFSWHRQGNWFAISGVAFQTVLMAFSQLQPLTPPQLATIYGQAMTQAYWPISQQTMSAAPLIQFDLMVQIDGEWVLALIAALQANQDVKLSQVLSLWLRWHLAQQPATKREAIIAIIVAIEQGDWQQTGDLLIKTLPALAMS